MLNIIQWWCDQHVYINTKLKLRDILKMVLGVGIEPTRSRLFGKRTVFLILGVCQSFYRKQCGELFARYPLVPTWDCCHLRWGGVFSSIVHNLAFFLLLLNGDICRRVANTVEQVRVLNYSCFFDPFFVRNYLQAFSFYKNFFTARRNKFNYCAHVNNLFV